MRGDAVTGSGKGAHQGLAPEGADRASSTAVDGHHVQK